MQIYQPVRLTQLGGHCAVTNRTTANTTTPANPDNRAYQYLLNDGFGQKCKPKNQQRQSLPTSPQQLVGLSKHRCLAYWQNLGVATIEFASWLFVPSYRLWLSFNNYRCVAVNNLP